MLVQGDARHLPLRDASVQCVVTSPPYFGQRDYRVVWVDGQIGLEDTPEAYVANMVEVFREVWRVLRDDGTLWLNLGDSYHAVKAYRQERDGERWTAKRTAGVADRAVHIPASGRETDILAAAAERLVAEALGRTVDNADVGLCGDDCDLWFRGLKVNVKWTPREHGRLLSTMREQPCDLYVLVTGQSVEQMKIRGWARRSDLERGITDLGHGPTYALHQSELSPFSELLRQSHRLKPKDVIGIPWRVAFALQADGWWLRQDIIWHKPNPMPESVTDRCTKAHEYLFLLTKSARYLWDAEAMKEEAAEPERQREDRIGGANGHTVRHSIGGVMNGSLTRNRRSVWTINTMPFAGAHFATMPEALVEPCILAGSRPGDLCCDPFVGSGTVGAVCNRLDRRWVGLDLAYQDIARKRTAQRGLRFS